MSPEQVAAAASRVRAAIAQTAGLPAPESVCRRCGADVVVVWRPRTRRYAYRCLARGHVEDLARPR